MVKKINNKNTTRGVRYNLNPNKEAEHFENAIRENPKFLETFRGIRSDSVVSPCEDLWASVITQALQDLMIKGKNKERQRAKSDAVKWFFEGGSQERDFKYVCSLAGISPEFVRKLALILFENPNILENDKKRH
jgi:hypothetical protein